MADVLGAMAVVLAGAVGPFLLKDRFDGLGSAAPHGRARGAPIRGPLPRLPGPRVAASSGGAGGAARRGLSRAFSFPKLFRFGAGENRGGGGGGSGGNNSSGGGAADVPSIGQLTAMEFLEKLKKTQKMTEDSIDYSSSEKFVREAPRLADELKQWRQQIESEWPASNADAKQAAVDVVRDLQDKLAQRLAEVAPPPTHAQNDADEPPDNTAGIAAAPPATPESPESPATPAAAATPTTPATTVVPAECAQCLQEKEKMQIKVQQLEQEVKLRDAQIETLKKALSEDEAKIRELTQGLSESHEGAPAPAPVAPEGAPRPQAPTAPAGTAAGNTAAAAQQAAKEAAEAELASVREELRKTLEEKHGDLAKMLRTLVQELLESQAKSGSSEQAAQERAEETSRSAPDADANPLINGARKEDSVTRVVDAMNTAMSSVLSVYDKQVLSLVQRSLEKRLELEIQLQEAQKSLDQTAAELAGVRAQAVVDAERLSQDCEQKIQQLETALRDTNEKLPLLEEFLEWVEKQVKENGVESVLAVRSTNAPPHAGTAAPQSDEGELLLKNRIEIAKQDLQNVHLSTLPELESVSSDTAEIRSANASSGAGPSGFKNEQGRAIDAQEREIQTGAKNPKFKYLYEALETKINELYKHFNLQESPKKANDESSNNNDSAPPVEKSNALSKLNAIIKEVYKNHKEFEKLYDGLEPKFQEKETASAAEQQYWQAEIPRLKQNLQEAKDAQKAAEAAKGECEATIRKLEKELDEAATARQAAEEVKEAKEAEALRAAEAEKAARAATQAATKAAENLRVAQKTTEEKTVELGLKEAELYKVHEQLQKTTQAKEKATKNHEELEQQSKTRIQELTQNNEKLNAEIRELKKTNEEHEKEKNNCNEKLETLQATAELLRKQMRTQNTRSQSDKRDMDEAQIKIENLNKSLKEAEAAAQAAEKAKEAKKVEAAEAAQAAEKAAQAAEKAKMAAEVAESEKSQCEKEIAVLKREIEESEKMYQEKLTKINELERELKATIHTGKMHLEKKSRETDSKLKNLQQTIETQKRENIRRNQEIAALRQEIHSLKETKNQLEQEKMQLEEVKKSCEQSMQAQTSRSQSDRQERDEAVGKIQNLKTRILGYMAGEHGQLEAKTRLFYTMAEALKKNKFPVPNTKCQNPQSCIEELTNRLKHTNDVIKKIYKFVEAEHLLKPQPTTPKAQPRKAWGNLSQSDNSSNSEEPSSKRKQSPLSNTKSKNKKPFLQRPSEPHQAIDLLQGPDTLRHGYVHNIE